MGFDVAIVTTGENGYRVPFISKSQSFSKVKKG